ncbi:hypothetical protein J7T55_015328 [Diaporthe amygdali]|uniref:uncharacterized protein n=1 Tax=Phomopsis amygdali TaxID=1214568 RepID=UPI0022FDE897|nr:uncharacterized protein J7T55_015328 [Diaporthe amygdali]KAJ0120599.1 hypothetical protein J7T55_015328 [Diaporthe amygdali]
MDIATDELVLRARQQGPSVEAILKVMSLLDPKMQQGVPEEVSFAGVGKFQASSAPVYTNEYRYDSRYPQDMDDFFRKLRCLEAARLVHTTLDRGRVFYKMNKALRDRIWDRIGTRVAQIGEHGGSEAEYEYRDDLHEVFNTAISLVAAVWPFAGICDHNDTERLNKMVEIKYLFLSLVKTLAFLGPAVKQARVDIQLFALMNDFQWMSIFHQRLRKTSQCFAKLSQEFLEYLRDDGYETLRLVDPYSWAKLATNYPDDDFSALAVMDPEVDKVHRFKYSKILSDSHRYQGINALYTGSHITATRHLGEWFDMLLVRISEYDDHDDKMTLAAAYNYLGMAMMRKPTPNVEGAKKLWIQACKQMELWEAPEGRTPPGFSIFPYPYANLALLAAYYGGPVVLIDRYLQAVVKSMNRNGDSSVPRNIEDGLNLVWAGNIYLMRGQHDLAYHYHKKGLGVLKETCLKDSVEVSWAHYRLAVDRFNRGEYKDVISILSSSTPRFWKEIPYQRAQKARMLWKLGCAERADGDLDFGRQTGDEALQLRRELLPDERDFSEPDSTDEDWDKLVFYLYR